MAEKLIPAYREMAEAGTANFHGLTVMNHTKQIGRLARAVGARTMLDFGCGRGDAYRSPNRVYHQWGFGRADVTLYDPAFHQNNKLPTSRYDLVVCSDVLEHIPEDEVDAFVSRLFGYAKRAVWASVCCRPAKKLFPDGVTNLHVTVQPYSWWLDTFNGHAEGKKFELLETP